jgi:hypothetical protein
MINYCYNILLSINGYSKIFQHDILFQKITYGPKNENSQIDNLGSFRLAYLCN